MPPYRIELTRAAVRALGDLPKQALRRIDAAICALAENPYPPGARKLRDTDFYRVKIGNYRIVYQVEDDVLVVLVIRIGHRRDVYRHKL